MQDFALTRSSRGRKICLLYFLRTSCLRSEGWDILRSFTVHIGPLGEIMEWTAPAFEEVCLNCEINSYASAKL